MSWVPFPFPFFPVSLSVSICLYLLLHLFLFDTLSALLMDSAPLSLHYDLLFLAIFFFFLLSFWFLVRQLFSDVRGRTSLGGGQMWQCRQHLPLS